MAIFCGRVSNGLRKKHFRAMSPVQLQVLFCNVVSFKYGIENENLLASTKDALVDACDQNDTNLIFWIGILVHLLTRMHCMPPSAQFESSRCNTFDFGDVFVFLVPGVIVPLRSLVR